mgnify:CR=1 FL=1
MKLFSIVLAAISLLFSNFAMSQDLKPELKPCEGFEEKSLDYAGQTWGEGTGQYNNALNEAVESCDDGYYDSLENQREELADNQKLCLSLGCELVGYVIENHGCLLEECQTEWFTDPKDEIYRCYASGSYDISNYKCVRSRKTKVEIRNDLNVL